MYSFFVVFTPSWARKCTFLGGVYLFYGKMVARCVVAPQSNRCSNCSFAALLWKNIYFWLLPSKKIHLSKDQCKAKHVNPIFVVTETRLGSKPSFMLLTRPHSRASLVRYDSKAKVEEATLSSNRLSVSPFTFDHSLRYSIDVRFY